MFTECNMLGSVVRLFYFTYYCRRGAKKAVDEFSMLSAAHGYAERNKLLKDLFGQPFKVVRNRYDCEMFKARSVRDVRFLSHLVKKMQNCSVAIDHLGYGSELNAMHTLVSVIRHLPSQSQRRRAEAAEAISRVDHPNLST